MCCLLVGDAVVFFSAFVCGKQDTGGVVFVELFKVELAVSDSGLWTCSAHHYG